MDRWINVRNACVWRTYQDELTLVGLVVRTEEMFRGWFPSRRGNGITSPQEWHGVVRCVSAGHL
jgi:hypothetical protein